MWKLSWIGKAVLKLSTQEIGEIISDNNFGAGRSLTVKFSGREESLMLSNIGTTRRLDYAYFLGDELNAWYNFGDVQPGREKGPRPKKHISSFAAPSDFLGVDNG